jgi:hypothetical protein
LVIRLRVRVVRYVEAPTMAGRDQYPKQAQPSAADCARRDGKRVERIRRRARVKLRRNRDLVLVNSAYRETNGDA